MSATAPAAASATAHAATPPVAGGSVQVQVDVHRPQGDGKHSHCSHCGLVSVLQVLVVLLHQLPDELKFKRHDLVKANLCRQKLTVLPS